ncbi:conserved membrane hypothetical protein [Candidatus Roizmanbacteria bacterium]|nr:conserved membrane hypothetical protein [Candidatus Roizmanbacteria bacterium]
MKENIFLAHLLVFFIYFIGLYYLFKIIFLLTKNRLLSLLTALFYGINFTHIFQLYYLATFQDMAIFTFLCLSFYNLLKDKRISPIVFFILALLSKETAILFVPFLILFKLFFNKKISWKRLLPYIVLGIIFALIYQYSLRYVTTLDNYKINFNPRLIINNLMWYFLWSLGLPNFMPDYIISIFKPPISEFGKLIINFPNVKIFLYSLLIYFGILLVSIFVYLIENKKRIMEFFLITIFLLSGFLIFIGPIAFFQHKWMVRLALPLIFISFIQSFGISLLIENGQLKKMVGSFLIGLYIFINILGVSIHESSSTFQFESRITKNALKYLSNNKIEILKHKYIYFKDSDKKDFNPWGESKKLKVTLGDQNFIDHYFPGSKLKAVYGFEDKKIPKDAYIINSFDILLL